MTLLVTEIDKKLLPSDSVIKQSIGRKVAANPYKSTHGTHSLPFILHPKVFRPVVVMSGQGHGSAVVGPIGLSLWQELSHAVAINGSRKSKILFFKLNGVKFRT